MSDPSRPPGPRSDMPVRAPGVRSRPVTVALIVIALVAAGAALHATAAVFVPLVAAILIALAVMPLRDGVRRRVGPRWGWLGTAAAMAVLVLVVGLFAGALWLAAGQVAAELPQQAGRVIEAAARQAGAEGAAGGPPVGDGALPGGAQGLALRFEGIVTDMLGGIAAAVVDSAVSIVSGVVVIFFLTLLILTESGDWRQKIAAVARRRTEWRLTESAEVIARKVRVYLLVRAVLGLITGALYGFWLWLFGAGLIVVWAMLAFLLNFVPTVGSIIAGLLPTVYLFVTRDFGTALGAGLGLLVIEQVMGNYVDPRLAGSRVAISPLVVLVALLVWSWIWGIPGALLAVPVTVALVVLGAHVPVLRPWALLLSDRTDMDGLRRATRPE